MVNRKKICTIALAVVLPWHLFELRFRAQILWLVSANITNSKNNGDGLGCMKRFFLSAYYSYSLLYTDILFIFTSLLCAIRQPNRRLE